MTPPPLRKEDRFCSSCAHLTLEGCKQGLPTIYGYISDKVTTDRDLGTGRKIGCQEWEREGREKA
jgi:hypothetical protein